MKLVCLECKVTRDRTAPDVKKTGRVYRCGAGHPMLKARSPVVMGVFSAFLAVLLAVILRLFVALATNQDSPGAVSAVLAVFGALLVYAGSKRLDPRVRAAGVDALGRGIGFLAAIGLMWVLHVLGLPGPLE